MRYILANYFYCWLHIIKKVSFIKIAVRSYSWYVDHSEVSQTEKG